MILSDYLSRQKVDDSDPHEIIPISFDMRDILQKRYYKIKGARVEDKYMVQTRSQAKASGVNLPEVHGMDNGLVPYIRPERQTAKPSVTQTKARTSTYKPRVGHGRAGIKRKTKMVTPDSLNKWYPQY